MFNADVDNVFATGRGEFGADIVVLFDRDRKGNDRGAP